MQSQQALFQSLLHILWADRPPVQEIIFHNLQDHGKRPGQENRSVNVALGQTCSDRRAVIGCLTPADEVGKAAVLVMVLTNHIQNTGAIGLDLLFSMGGELKATVQYIDCIYHMTAFCRWKFREAGVY